MRAFPSRCLTCQTQMLLPSLTDVDQAGDARGVSLLACHCSVQAVPYEHASSLGHAREGKAASG